MLVLVALRQRRNAPFELRHIAPAIVDCLRGGDTRDGEKSIHIIADALDLFELVFNPDPIGFCRGQFAGQFLKFVFNQAAATTRAAGSTLTSSSGRASAELQRVRGFFLILSDSRFTALQVRFQTFLFFQKVAQGVLAKCGPLRDRIADEFATDGFSQPLRHYRIAICHVKIDQASAAADYRLNHSGHRAAKCFFERSEAGRIHRFIGFLRR